MTEQGELVHNVVNELREMRDKETFVPTPDIDIVWVVSTYGTVTQHPQEDNLYRDRYPDRERVDYGIDLIRKITALRLNKDEGAVTKEEIDEHGPILYYNGDSRTTKNSRYTQNEDLQQLVDRPDFPLPASHMVIEPIEENNTPSQVVGFADFLQRHADVRKVAVVSHGPHSRRISRYLEQYRSLYPTTITLENASIREMGTPVGGTLREVKKIVKYANQGDLSEKPLF